MGTALAASPLVEEHDPVRGGVEELPLERLGSAAWAAVHEKDRLAVGVARLLVVELVEVGDLQVPLLVGLEGRIELAHEPGL